MTAVATQAVRVDLDDLWAAQWVRAYDAAWLSEDVDRVGQLLAQNAEFRSNRRRSPLIGRKAVLEDIREFFKRARVQEYCATDLVGRRSGTVGVIRYSWRLEWTFGSRLRVNTGRDTLILHEVGGRWVLQARVSREDARVAARGRLLV